MREWLPAGHLVWFLLDVIERVDTSVLHARHPNDGVGRAAYDPDMLLAVLLYAYCSGVRSSRQIERLCTVDVAFRVLAGGSFPDHTTIARFRQGHEDVAVGLFCDVLTLCAEAGLAQVGVIAVDGTKISADASRKANRTREQIEAEVKASFVEAAAVDAGEDALFGDRRGDEVPAELVDPRRRAARLDAALVVLEQRRVAAQAQQAEAEAAARAAWEQRRRDSGPGRRPAGRPPQVMEVEMAAEALAVEQARAVQRAKDRAEREAAAAAQGRKLNGKKPTDPEQHRRMRRARQRLANAIAQAEAAAEADDGDTRVNVTDPDSRIMITANGWVQGYNAQAAANEQGIVIAAEVTTDANDVGQCAPMLERCQATLDRAGITDPIGVVLFDAGYCSEHNLTVEGPDRLIATAKSWKLRRQAPTEGPPPDDAGPIEAMQHRLRTPDGAALYAKRQHTIEPVFGDVKHLRGLRRFSRRGLRAANAEWHLQLAAHNILKLFRAQTLAV